MDLNQEFNFKATNKRFFLKDVVSFRYEIDIFNQGKDMNNIGIVVRLKGDKIVVLEWEAKDAFEKMYQEWVKDISIQLEASLKRVSELEFRKRMINESIKKIDSLIQIVENETSNQKERNDW